MSVSMNPSQRGYAKVAAIIVLAAIIGGSYLFYNVMSLRAKEEFHRAFAQCYVNLYGMADAVNSGGGEGNEKFKRGKWFLGENKDKLIRALSSFFIDSDDTANQICNKVMDISYWDKDLYSLEESHRQTLAGVLKMQQEFIRNNKGKWKLYLPSDYLKSIFGEAKS